MNREAVLIYLKITRTVVMPQETYLQKANSNQECLDIIYIKLCTMYIRLGLFNFFLSYQTNAA